MGIDNYNIDLIYGLPGQSLSDWQENLEQAISYRPPHLSLYLLQLDPSTPLARMIAGGQLHSLDEELEAQMYYTGIEYLDRHGYQHYEISNFAAAGYECRHNLNYWRGYDYLGLGPGAVSLLGGRRLLNKPDVAAYLTHWLNDRPGEQEVLENMTGSEQIADAVIMGLRMTGGIDRDIFARRFGIDIMEQYHDIIEDCIEQGLLKAENNRVFLTCKGYFLSNQVLCRFITCI
jgi:oxygen-independent coproporphyrinogen-3 oxidase